MYDYVIVGAGSAGCVLAARLTEDPDVSVLLLEAGPPDANQNIHVPLGYLKLSGTELDWDYFTRPSRTATAAASPAARRVLGGSSSTNAMVYIRGNPRDYDAWRIPGWSWDDLLPYFKQGRGQRARRLGVARRRRAAARVRAALAQQDRAGLGRGGRAGRAARPTTTSTGPSRTAPACTR